MFMTDMRALPRKCWVCAVLIPRLPSSSWFVIFDDIYVKCTLLCKHRYWLPLSFHACIVLYTIQLCSCYMRNNALFHKRRVCAVLFLRLI